MSDKVIFKYTLRWVDTQLIEMQDDAEPLTAQMQGENPQVWVICTPDAPKVPRPFHLLGTGHTVSSDPGRYIGTVQTTGGMPTDKGTLVFHVFAGWRRS